MVENIWLILNSRQVSVDRQIRYLKIFSFNRSPFSREEQRKQNFRLKMKKNRFSLFRFLLVSMIWLTLV